MGFLIALLVIFVVLPWVIKQIFPWLLKRHLRKRFGNIFDQQMPHGGYDEPEERKGGWSAPPPRKKKIDPETGEYVKFQEVKVEATLSETDADGTRSSHIQVEEQIVDIDWEEIPKS